MYYLKFMGAVQRTANGFFLRRDLSGVVCGESGRTLSTGSGDGY